MFVICNVSIQQTEIYTNACTAIHFTKMHRQVLHALNAILKVYCELKNISANLIKYETVCTEFFVTNVANFHHERKSLRTNY